MPFLVAIVGGLVLGWTSGGNWQRLKSIQVSKPLLLVALFLVQGVSRGRLWITGFEQGGLLIWACISMAMVLVVTASRLQGLNVLAVGVTLNLLVVLLNGFMPVITREAAVATGGGFYVVSNTSAIAAWLSDVLQFEIFGQTYLLSAGDVLLVIGVVVLLVESMTTGIEKKDFDSVASGRM